MAEEVLRNHCFRSLLKLLASSESSTAAHMLHAHLTGAQLASCATCLVWRADADMLVVVFMPPHASFVQRSARSGSGTDIVSRWDAVGSAAAEVDAGEIARRHLQSSGGAAAEGVAADQSAAAACWLAGAAIWIGAVARPRQGPRVVRPARSGRWPCQPEPHPQRQSQQRTGRGVPAADLALPRGQQWDLQRGYALVPAARPSAANTVHLLVAGLRQSRAILP